MKKGKKRSFKQKKSLKVSKIKKLLVFLIRLIILPFFIIYELLKKLFIKIPIIVLEKLKILLHKLKLFVFKKPAPPIGKRPKVKYFDDGDLQGCHKCNGSSGTNLCVHKKKKLQVLKQERYEQDSGSKLELGLKKVESALKKLIVGIKKIIRLIINKLKSIVKELVLIIKYIKNKILVTLSKISYHFNRKLNKSIDNKDTYKSKPKYSKVKKPRLISSKHKDESSCSESINEEEILPTFEIIKTVTYNTAKVPPIPHSSRPKQFTVNCTEGEINGEAQISLNDTNACIDINSKVLNNTSMSASTNVDSYFETFDAVEAI